MAFTALFTRDPVIPAALERAAGGFYAVTHTASWQGFLRLIRERPVTTAGLDLSALPAERTPEEALADIGARFPNLGLIVLSDRHTDPVGLFRLGRVAGASLVLVGIEELGQSIPRALETASERGATALVTRELSPYLPGPALGAVRIAMDGVHRRWSAERFAAEVGFSRPFLSERLKACSLPSAGHLLIWARLLHAGFWLVEPGRTGESVSRQLEYSSGAAFRRALKLYTGATPGEVAKGGGLKLVLDRFFDACGLTRSGGVAAA